MCLNCERLLRKLGSTWLRRPAEDANKAVKPESTSNPLVEKIFEVEEIILVVGTIKGILVRMGLLTGRGQVVKDGRIIMDPGLGTRMLLTRKMDRAGAKEMVIRSVQARTKEVEVINNGRTGTKIPEIRKTDQAGAKEMLIRSIQAGAMEVEMVRNGKVRVQQVMELVMVGTTMSQNRL
ncbi:hypothetical protein RJT34_09612 [Clitoria ternatea]|uniref:Uncharacterized protein n=1 Tax=Clitoria ternatea TaxID=43366 RepID=A0AAN9K5Y8_CLITE